MDIVIQHACEFEGLPGDEQLTKWAIDTIEFCRTKGDFCIRLVECDEMQSLNRDYRGKDKPTNVLSFEAFIPDEIEPNFLGDIVICPQVVHNEAAEQGKHFHDHFAHMVVHGTLHLLGYDHEDESDATEMEGLEVTILRAHGIDNPYEESA